MKNRYNKRVIAFSLLILLAYLGSNGISDRFYDASIQEASITLPPSSDPESILSYGKKISLQSADIYALELIPKVSDTLAYRIFHSKNEIIKTARYLSPSKKSRSFEIISGVGATKARDLYQYLENDERGGQ